MEIFKIVMIGLLALTLVVFLREHRPEIAIQISIVVGLIIFVFVLTKLSSVVNILKYFAAKTNIDLIYFTTILKVIAIAYITEFGAQVCKDAGEGSIASKIEFGGKVLIMIMAIPILAALMDVITKLMA